jgi:hypothetical protein
MAVFVALMVFIGLALAGLHFYTRLRHLEVMMQTVSPLPDAGRYKPMLRLLSADDEQMLAGNPAVLRDFRKQRIAIFRMYLRSLTKDYGTLLAGIRTAMAYSADDRPELATALSKNRVHFTMAVCRIEYGLFLYSFGVGSVDVSGLVEAIDGLRKQVSILTPAISATA